MTTQLEDDTICCPKFDPAPWEDKIIEWEHKKFVKRSVFTFFYMPVNFRKVMKSLDAKVKENGAEIPDWLCLSDHTSKWNMDVYLAVDKDLPGEENTTLSGKFYSKVYEGPYKDTGKWSNDFRKTAESKGFNIKKWFMWYTTCPKCAKKYGKNYVAIISQLSEN
jgi:hypothetical protein